MNPINLQRIRGLDGPVLLTGHTGFKGTWMTFLLEKLGVEVIGFSLPPVSQSLFDRSKRIGKIRENFANIENFSSLSKYIHEAKPSAIIHMAAQPLVLDSYKDALGTFSTNVQGTANLLEASFHNDFVKSVIVVTTDKVYKNDNSGRRFIESDALVGKDPYSASKVGAEAAVAAWQQISKIQGGPRVTSVRAGNVVGGGDFASNRLLPDFIRAHMNNEKLSVRNPSSTRPWQHVLDPLSGYLMALEANLSGLEINSVNFGPPAQSLSVSEVIKIATESWPTRVEIELGEVQTNPSAEAEELNLDSTFASEKLGWQPHWSQEKSIISTIEWWDSVINKGVSSDDACGYDISQLNFKSLLMPQPRRRIFFRQQTQFVFLPQCIHRLPKIMMSICH